MTGRCCRCLSWAHISMKLKSARNSSLDRQRSSTAPARLIATRAARWVSSRSRSSSTPRGLGENHARAYPPCDGSAVKPARKCGSWCAHASERTSQEHVRAALQQFLASACLQSQREPAQWMGSITRRLQENTALTVSRLAVEVERHPSWMGSAYRHATGESVQETAARFRVERATCLLRETDQPYASIALEAGFCDQSHMNRTFRRFFARSPAAIRQDGRNFRQARTGFHTAYLAVSKAFLHIGAT